MAKIKAIKYLGWKFLRIPHTASEDEALSWPGGFEGAGGDGAVKSVNGKTGSVEITAEDIPVGTDSTVALALESKVSKVGDTMTGQLYIETISRLDTVYSSAIALLPHKEGEGNRVPIILEGSPQGNFRIRSKTSPLMSISTISATFPKGARINGSSNILDVVWTNHINNMTAHPSLACNLLGYSEIMPAPSATLLNSILFYIGPTNENYTNNRFYKVIEDNGYKWKELTVNSSHYINNNASTYTLESISSLFTSSDAKLAKVYNEAKLPTTGAYTIFSLGWTYTDSENAPALLAVELATGKLYYYQGTEANCTSTAWKEFNFGGATPQSADDYGIRGDYCSKYGVIKIGTKPDIISSTEILWVGPNIIKMPGTLANPSESLVTVANSITHTIHKTTDFDLVYVHGLDDLLECDKVCFSRTKPTEEGTCQVWFNGIEWKFRDVNQGNVWTAARCQPLGRVIFTDGTPTRIDYVGWYHPNMYNA